MRVKTSIEPIQFVCLNCGERGMDAAMEECCEEPEVARFRPVRGPFVGGLPRPSVRDEMR